MIMQLFYFYHAPSFHIGDIPFPGDDPYTRHIKVDVYQSKSKKTFDFFGTIEMTYSDLAFCNPKSLDFQMCSPLQTFKNIFSTSEAGVISIDSFLNEQKNESDITLALQNLLLFLHAQEQIQHIVLSPFQKVRIETEHTTYQNIYESYGFSPLSSGSDTLHMETIQTEKKLTHPVCHVLQEKRVGELMFVYSSIKNPKEPEEARYVFYDKQKSKTLFKQAPHPV